MRKRKSQKLIRAWQEAQRKRLLRRNLKANPVITTGLYTVRAPNGAVRQYRASTSHDAMRRFNRTSTIQYPYHVLKINVVEEPIRRFSMPIGDRYVQVSR